MTREVWLYQGKRFASKYHLARHIMGSQAFDDCDARNGVFTIWRTTYLHSRRDVFTRSFTVNGLGEHVLREDNDT